MRYVMRQKFFALGQDYTIVDDSGREHFQVTSKLLSFGHSLVMRSLIGRDTLAIRQRVLSFGPTYEILRGDDVIAIVRKEIFTFLSCRFEVDVPGPDDLTASGDLLDKEYVFERHGRAVAAVSKQWFSWTDTYGVETTAGEDDALILASAVVIDLACHDR